MLKLQIDGKVISNEHEIHDGPHLCVAFGIVYLLGGPPERDRANYIRPVLRKTVRVKK